MLFVCAALPGCADRAAERAVRTAVGDDEARLQRLTKRGPYICGEVGSRRLRQDRAYVRFVFDARGGRALVDPGEAGASPAVRSGDAACRRPQAYQTVAERMGCAAAPDQAAQAQRQLAFDQLWHSACSGPGGS